MLEPETEKKTAFSIEDCKVKKDAVITRNVIFGTEKRLFKMKQHDHVALKGTLTIWK